MGKKKGLWKKKQRKEVPFKNEMEFSTTIQWMLMPQSAAAPPPLQAPPAPLLATTKPPPSIAVINSELGNRLVDLEM